MNRNSQTEHNEPTGPAAEQTATWFFRTASGFNGSRVSLSLWSIRWTRSGPDQNPIRTRSGDWWAASTESFSFTSFRLSPTEPEPEPEPAGGVLLSSEALKLLAETLLEHQMIRQSAVKVLVFVSRTVDRLIDVDSPQDVGRLLLLIGCDRWLLCAQTKPSWCSPPGLCSSWRRSRASSWMYPRWSIADFDKPTVCETVKRF